MQINDGNNDDEITNGDGLCTCIAFLYYFI